MSQLEVTTSARHMSKEVLEKLTKQQSGRPRACSDDARGAGSAPEGTVQLRLDAATDGTVRKVTATGGQRLGAGLLRCLERSYMDAFFLPSPDGPFRVDLVLDFAAQTRPGAPQRPRPVTTGTWMDGRDARCVPMGERRGCQFHLDCGLDEVCMTGERFGEPNQCASAERREGTEADRVCEFTRAGQCVEFQ